MELMEDLVKLKQIMLTFKLSTSIFKRSLELKSTQTTILFALLLVYPLSALSGCLSSEWVEVMLLWHLPHMVEAVN